MKKQPKMSVKSDKTKMDEMKKTDMKKNMSTMKKKMTK